MAKKDEDKEKKTAKAEEEETISLTEFIFEWANALFLALVVVLLLLIFVFRQVTVNGTSMTNTLQHNDRLIATNFMYTPQNGDIVVISHGQNYSKPIIKRVIAVGGQSLDIDYSTGEVKVDGVVQNEKYIKGTTKQLLNPLDIPEVIPDGYIFVMGDNREGSLDSRSKDIGLIPIDNIIGKAEWRTYPFESFGTVYYNME